MKLSEFYKIADALAPKALSDEYCKNYSAYDNSGILIDTGAEVNKVLFTLDLSFSAVEKAIETGANLIVTHHPVIYGKISEIIAGDFQPLGEKLIKCIQNGISVISMHLNLDCVAGGIDESLQEGIVNASGGEKTTASVMHALSNGGYGRAYPIKPTTLTALAEGIRKQFSTDRLLVYGEGDKTIEKVASFCGSGADEWAVQFALEAGAQVVVSSDFKHHVLMLALEKGLSVIALTHYASENYGFKKYYEKISQKAKISCVYHEDSMLF